VRKGGLKVDNTRYEFLVKQPEPQAEAPAPALEEAPLPEKHTYPGYRLYEEPLPRRKDWRKRKPDESKYLTLVKDFLARNMESARVSVKGASYVTIATQLDRISRENPELDFVVRRRQKKTYIVRGRNIHTVEKPVEQEISSEE
jgi:hypothetical protein